MLLKANSVRYQDTDVIDEDEDFIEEIEEVEEFEVGQTLLLGIYENRLLEEGEEPTFEGFDLEEDSTENLEYDEENDIYIGEIVTIGGGDYSSDSYSYQDTNYYDDDIDEEIPQVTDEIDDLLGGDISDIQEAPKKPTSEGEMLVDDFSNAINSLAESLERDVPSWRDKQVGANPNEAASGVLQSYLTDSIIDFSQYEFISQEEKDNILAEVTGIISNAQDFNTINTVMQDLEDTIKRIIEEQAGFYVQEIDAEKEQVMLEIESHIEEVLNQQREAVQEEAEEHIEKTIEFFRSKMSEDEQLVVAANNIISRKEQILDEAYSRSLKLIEEASEQAERIIEDSMYSKQEAERIKDEAKNEGKLIVQRYRDESENIIAEANIESAKIIQTAEEQHQEIVEAATQDGFNVGYQEGREEAIRENAQLLMDTTNALNQLHSAFPAAVKENEGRLIKLTVKVADAMLRDEIIARPEICVKTLDRAIRRVSDLERVLIKVNPLDLDLILPKESYFKGILADVQDFVITGHYAIPRGGCLIETNSGTIDGQFHTQLNVARDLFDKIRSEYDDADEEAPAEEAEE
ncbi:MAG: FliH/SctL family protein [Candidatus Sericytochromatia bacterium]